jgi:CobQ-like glutamine amidotransferase family enzyme
MKIEVLFPEVANLYGDLSNIEYLKKCLDNNVEIIETSLSDEPAFFTQKDINLVYMAGMTEKSQEIVIKKLKPHADLIEEKIKNGQLFFLTGNAMEILGKFIENEDNSQIRAVGIYHFYAHREMMDRYSGCYLGKHNDIEIVGFKAQFTTSYGNNDDTYFAKTELGMGINIGTKCEGLHRNNLFATSILGPILILNPLFTKELLKLMGVENPKLAFEEEVMAAYNERLKKLQKMAEKQQKEEKKEEKKSRKVRIERNF